LSDVYLLTVAGLTLDIYVTALLS